MQELFFSARSRRVFLPATVEMELLAGIRNLRGQRLLEALLNPFYRHNRILLPNLEDYRKAGQILAETGFPVSKHANDALISVCARKIGAELWTLNKQDFAPLCGILQVAIGPQSPTKQIE